MPEYNLTEQQFNQTNSELEQYGINLEPVIVADEYIVDYNLLNIHENLITLDLSNLSSTGNTPIDLEAKKIKERKKDGVIAYERSLAAIRLGRLLNAIPHETYRINVFVPLSNVVNSINIGSWLDAYEFLNTVVSNPYLSEATLTDFRLIISDYIVNSGNYTEYSGNSIDSNGYII